MKSMHKGANCKCWETYGQSLLLTEVTASATSVRTVGRSECSRILFSNRVYSIRFMHSSGPRLRSNVMKDAPLKYTQQGVQNLVQEQLLAKHTAM